MAVRSGKINILKNTARLLSFRKRHRHIGLNPLFRRDRNHLSRLHIADKLRTDGIKGTALRSDDIGIIPLTDAERLKSKGISRPDQLPRTGNHQCICAFQLLAGSAHRFLRGMGIYTFSCHMVGNHLGVNGGLKNRACTLQILAELSGIDQISVVRQCQRPLDIIQHKGLGIFSRGGARRGIAHMPHSDIPFHPLQILRRKHLIDKPHPFVGGNPALRARWYR